MTTIDAAALRRQPVRAKAPLFEGKRFSLAGRPAESGG